MKKIFVTGGAGYIGIHLAKQLLKENFEIIIFDNLSNGFWEPLKILKKKFCPLGNLEFIRGDLSDEQLIEHIFTNTKIEAVIHLAALTNVIESIQNPELYHQENFLNSINLIEAMTKNGVNKIIFSSTAAVYGNPQYTPIDENHPTNPLNPYAQTKLDFEKYLSQVANLKYLILRFFNVGGSDPNGLIGRSHLKAQDLFENIFKVVLGQKETLEIYGKDFDTPDGTPIRDFVHVEDIVQAHILALEELENLSGEIFNLGSEQGFSVKEIVEKTSIVIQRELPTKIIEKREGEIAVSVASSQKAKEILGWSPIYSDLETIIKSDWNWRKNHPVGYTN